jgi:hypothetical protein
MTSIVVVLQILTKGQVDLIDAFKVLYSQKLVSNGPEKTLDFRAALGTSWGCVGLAHAQICAHDFQVTTVVGRTVVGV